ncbi:MAG: DUF1566 domain-containing protein [Spirochaetes bacterium]|jgi:hypothetical protein|nr:DUF1566 domain-containing protein [Spirochaetota bacterium]
MKAYRKIFTAVLLVAAAVFMVSGIDAKNKTYRIGDKGPAGGWIFYDKGKTSDGWRYLEAAPADQGTVKWGCYEQSISGASGTGIGTGRSNTRAIVNGCGEAGLAAKLCADFRGGGKSDWFLPSKDELNLMYTNLQKNGVGGFAAGYYWSSSENDAGNAWLQGFDIGFQSDVSKASSYVRVRAVRAF